ncbi:hypothetical protein VPFG_00201 [Vibrio phage nt-1]|uniref:Uncharacterized protein n=1 Tax=Vibrio phage nt-1 TaxID=115992 RepID=R9TEL7_9CAUD|nr:hypothetical protein VPFG_00201 [Vibrio phage nt-1]AGN30201.1 hypothetical protein VPFG_00201 [Vibrio phage nt-1]
MITLIQDQNSLQFMLNDELLLSATWESYIDQNYNCEVFKTAIVEIPSLSCTIVREEHYAESLIRTLLMQRELYHDDFHTIIDLFPHVKLEQEHNDWYCDCCGGVHDVCTTITNNQSNKQLDFFHDDHFGRGNSIMPHQLLEFCLDV